MKNSSLPALHSMISQLVSIPSVSSFHADLDTSNRPVCEKLAEWFEQIGCSSQLMPIPGERDNYNVIAQYGSGALGLALCGHTDTVPFDESRWSYDPLAGEIIDQRLYGIGSADMKGFLALCAKVVETIPLSSLKKSILFIGSADEESFMDGARYLSKIGFELPPYCIVGEPTDLQPIRQHKGIIMERVIINGQSGHSSNPALGANAIEGMHEVIQTIRGFRQDMVEEFHDDSFEVPVPTLNLGHISGGDNPNRICDRCSLDFDVRLMPGMSVNQSRHQLRQRIAQKLDHSPFGVQFETLFEGANPFFTPDSSPLLQACQHASGLAAGGVNFCTEGPFYSELGAETIVIGPGSIDVAHQADEYLPLDALPKMENILEKLIHQFCIESAD